MIDLRGKHATCKVMLDHVEPSAMAQLQAMLDCLAFAGSQIRIMPDVHAGAGCVIGFTGTLTDKVIPNVVGVDIGCGVRSVNLGNLGEWLFYRELDDFIREKIPSGFAVRERVADGASQLDTVAQVAEATGQDVPRVLRSLGTLGGGNHFIELGRDDKTSCWWLTVHTGSRNFGLKIANWHQVRAVPTVGRGRGLEWLEGDAKELYLRHMRVAQQFAQLNRRLITDQLVVFLLGPHHQLDRETVESVHNYIDFDDGVVRKGAIRAHVGERVVIPWNMRDGLIIGRGKGNADWNNSAPHGAGRVMGRGQAKRSLQVADFEKAMAGIWTSCVSKETIDESPMVYKPAEEILAVLGETVEVEYVVRPVYNFKAS